MFGFSTHDWGLVGHIPVTPFHRTWHSDAIRERFAASYLLRLDGLYAHAPKDLPLAATIPKKITHEAYRYAWVSLFRSAWGLISGSKSQTASSKSCALAICSG
jgi:hypothetical protein